MTSSTSDIGAGELRFSKMQLSFNHLSPGAIVQGKTALSSKYYIIESTTKYQHRFRKYACEWIVIQRFKARKNPMVKDRKSLFSIIDRLRSHFQFLGLSNQADAKILKYQSRPRQNQPGFSVLAGCTRCPLS